jgi:hypothetical protein
MQFPPWRPDAPEYDDGTLTGLVTAKNVYPVVGGYRPFRGLTEATGALPATWTGGGSFEYNGNSAFLGATAAGLYSHASGSWTSELALATTSPWFGAQFGDNVIFVNGTEMVKFTISSGTCSSVGSTPPDGATQIAIVREFVVASGVSSDSMELYWSAINNSESWTVGTDQSDFQQIADGGPITGISGGEYGVVFQSEHITLMEYVGTPLIFTFRKVERSIGCIAHGSIVQAEGLHFFLSKKGFKAWNPSTGVIHIGENAVDRTFLDSYSLSEIQTYLRAAVDPDRRLVYWAMPDALWIHNIETKGWSKVEVSGIIGISTGSNGTGSITLEDIAAIYPSLEDVTPTLDDPFWGGGGGGTSALYVFKTDNKAHTFSAGSPLEATLQTQIMEPNLHRVTHVKNTFLLTDATDGVTLNVDVARRPGDTQTRVSSSDLRTNGDIPIRASGGCLQMEWKLTGDWTYIKGYDIDVVAGGRL